MRRFRQIKSRQQDKIREKPKTGKDMMKSCLRSFLLPLLVATLCASGIAQKPAQKTESQDETKGFTEVETFQGTVNSDASVLKLDSTVGYDFNKHFGLFAGVPVYFAHLSSTSTAVGTTSYGTRSGLGNVYLGLGFRASNPTLDYASAITAGAPTGSRSK